MVTETGVATALEMETGLVPSLVTNSATAAALATETDLVTVTERASRYSKDPNNRPPPLTNRPPYQILPRTNSYFHWLCSYLDLLQ